MTSNSGREATLASGRKYVAGTADTKNAELAYVQRLISEQGVSWTCPRADPRATPRCHLSLSPRTTRTAPARCSAAIEAALIPVTDGDRTVAQWSATFDEAASEMGKYVRIVSKDVFAAGLKALSAHVNGRVAPPEAVRWQGLRPAKVFCSSVINGPVEAVWQRIRNFTGMGDWHPDITRMRMVDGVPPDKVSGVRDFCFDDESLQEQLTLLCDVTHSFRNKMNRGGMPWLNYHAGARLYPISDTNRTLAVWTADWIAAQNDDVKLIPMVHQDVFQKAIDTINARFFVVTRRLISN